MAPVNMKKSTIVKILPLAALGAAAFGFLIGKKQ